MSNKLFRIEINQPEFNELYKKYARLNGEGDGSEPLPETDNEWRYFFDEEKERIKKISSFDQLKLERFRWQDIKSILDRIYSLISPYEIKKKIDKNSPIFTSERQREMHNRNIGQKIFLDPKTLSRSERNLFKSTLEHMWLSAGAVSFENYEDVVITSKPVRAFFEGNILIKDRKKFEDYYAAVSELYQFIEQDFAAKFPISKPSTQATGGDEEASEKSSNNLDDNYKQSLFLLKTFYSKILEILDAFAGGYIAVRNNVINHYYTVLNSLVDETLNKKEFEELKNAKPEMFESLIGDIEDFDVEWEFGSKQAYDFLGKIEKLYILSGSPVFSLPDELKTFLQKTDEAVSEHRKYCYEQWQKLEKRTQNFKEQWDTKTSEAKDTQPRTDAQSSTEKLLNVVDGAITRGLESMFAKAPLQPSVQKIEIVKGKLEVDGLREGLMEIAQSKKVVGKPKFPYKLPAGTKWEEITIKFVDDESIYIQVKQFKHVTSYEELGLVGRGKNPNPSELWAFLKVLAQVNGELAINDAQARDKYKKQKELLTKALQSYFSLDYDPFYPYRSSSEKQGNSYKIKITLIPPPPSNNSKDTASIEDDDLGVKEYLKEQAPLVSEE